MGPGGDDVGCILTAGPQIEWGVLQVQLAGLDLREIQDVVDDVEQRVGRYDGRSSTILALLVVELGFQQQARSCR